MHKLCILCRTSCLKCEVCSLKHPHIYKKNNDGQKEDDPDKDKQKTSVGLVSIHVNSATGARGHQYLPLPQYKLNQRTQTR